jgi:hypothetical protein
MGPLLRRIPAAPASPLTVLLLLPVLLGPCASQGYTRATDLDEDLGGWAGWIVQGNLKAVDEDWKDWRFWFDGQARWRDDLETYDLTLLRPGLGYALSEHWTFHVGYGWIQTHPSSGTQVEHRPWEQLQWRAPVGDWNLISRSRLEQRFFEERGDAGWRLRQMLRGTAPIFGVSSPFLAASDEVFIDLNDTSWGQRSGLRQYRAFAGLGWFLNSKKTVSLEVGYLNQWLDREDQDRMNHVVSVNLFTNF